MRRLLQPIIAAVLGVTALVVLQVPAYSAIISHNFTTGVGPHFLTFAERNFWAVATDGTGLRVSKGQDDGSSFVPSPSGSYSHAGVLSNFKVGGDFSMSVNFSWNSVTAPAFGGGDNSAGLYLLFPGTDATGNAIITSSSTIALSHNFSHWSGLQKSNVLLPPLVVNLGELFDAPTSGTLDIVRQGNTLQFFQTNTDQNQQLIGSTTDQIFGGDMLIAIAGRQGQNVNSGDFSQIDPRGSMDVSFRSFQLDADKLMRVHETTALTLFAFGLIGLCLAARQRNTA